MNQHNTRRSRARGRRRRSQRDWVSDHVYVVGMKRFICYETGEMLDKEQFTDLFGHVKLGPHDSLSAASYFLHVGGGKKVQRVTFRPGRPQIVKEDGHSAFNVYRPPTVRPMHGSVKLWLDLGKHVIPDAAVRNHHLQYFAHLIQRPDVKINHALLLTGRVQGTGKDSWFAPVVRILGPLAGTITPDDLANAFNDYLYEKLLLVVEELADFGSDRLTNKLKPILARPPDMLRINRKNVPQFYIPNVVHSFMMSNFERPLAVDLGDRRFHVYQTPATRKPKEYYLAYYHWLDDHLGDVLGFLQQYSLTGFNAYAQPPMTIDKQTLIAASEPLLDQHLRAITDDLPDLVALADIRDSLPGRLKETSPHRLAACLKQLGAREVGRVRLANKRSHVWALRRPALYSDFSEKTLKNKYLAMHSKDMDHSVDHFGGRAGQHFDQ